MKYNLIYVSQRVIFLWIWILTHLDLISFYNFFNSSSSFSAGERRNHAVGHIVAVFQNKAHNPDDATQVYKLHFSIVYHLFLFSDVEKIVYKKKYLS